MSLQTPLARARGLGSAKHGFHHWWMERLSSVALVPLSLWFIAALLSLKGADYNTMLTWARSPINATLLIALTVATFYHAALGVQVVIEDYIATKSVKMTTLVGVQFTLIFLGLAAIVAVLQILFGAA